ncbi:transmembrane protein 114 [Lacerta agilis]|uniref:transmembrane protein 114 n=1 Tax=Lacerta agilis TaxID=80427 RepID=UPI001419A984|nr:transmembrane protein 114 [Lacerta agilis]
MKVTLNAISLLAAFAGVVSFSFLVVAISTDFWYLIDASKLQELMNHTDSLNSHLGLWRACPVNSDCFHLANPFKHDISNITTSHKQLLNMHGAVLILLPLSLILFIFGAMTGFISILAQAYFLLVFTGLLFLFGALITLAGISICIAFFPAGFREAIFLMGKKNLLDIINIQFGWSLAFAWLSLAAEILTGLAFLLMARMVDLKQRQDCTL